MMCWWGVTHKLTHLAMWVHKRPGDTWTYICVHKLWRVPKQDDVLIGLGVCLHIHEKKTIYGLMNAHRRGFWIGVDTAKLTGHQCNFVTGTHTHPHTTCTPTPVHTQGFKLHMKIHLETKRISFQNIKTWINNDTEHLKGWFLSA